MSLKYGLLTDFQHRQATFETASKREFVFKKISASNLAIIYQRSIDHLTMLWVIWLKVHLNF